MALTSSTNTTASWIASCNWTLEPSLSRQRHSRHTTMKVQEHGRCANRDHRRGGTARPPSTPRHREVDEQHHIHLGQSAPTPSPRLTPPDITTRLVSVKPTSLENPLELRRLRPIGRLLGREPGARCVFVRSGVELKDVGLLVVGDGGEALGLDHLAHLEWRHAGLLCWHALGCVAESEHKPPKVSSKIGHVPARHPGQEIRDLGRGPLLRLLDEPLDGLVLGRGRRRDALDLGRARGKRLDGLRGRGLRNCRHIATGLRESADLVDEPSPQLPRGVRLLATRRQDAQLVEVVDHLRRVEVTDPQKLLAVRVGVEFGRGVRVAEDEDAVGERPVDAADLQLLRLRPYCLGRGVRVDLDDEDGLVGTLQFLEALQGVGEIYTLTRRRPQRRSEDLGDCRASGRERHVDNLLAVRQLLHDGRRLAAAPWSDDDQVLRRHLPAHERVDPFLDARALDVLFEQVLGELRHRAVVEQAPGTSVRVINPSLQLHPDVLGHE
mmetsp:Transcript_728/g.2893  ORF Transcript_728/g.2893 Transcript_728/m.2893 type:complete len:495 (-) Transcript_728:257-1741(-)